MSKKPARIRDADGTKNHSNLHMFWKVFGIKGSLLTFTDLEEDGAWDRLTAKRYSLGGDAPEEWDLPLRQW